MSQLLLQKTVKKNRLEWHRIGELRRVTPRTSLGLPCPSLLLVMENRRMSPLFVPVMTSDTSLHRWLKRRLLKPQRHRLLHGYPLAAAMPSISSETQLEITHTPQMNRGLLVGVLPHPFCNPKVRGCGFCTFPHEQFHARKSEAVVETVIREIEQRTNHEPNWTNRPVTGLYFGGGSANLTPPESFQRLCRQLRNTFDLSQAEVTLEGVPAYFLKRRPLLIDILKDELPARHFRLSMGVQTFDQDTLEKMGRLGFGTKVTFQAIVKLAHRRGMTISADLLFNLPGQTLPQMQRDLRQAIDIGLDHLGLYHLVMFPGLGTEWSRDSNLLARLPDNHRAADNWLQLRGFLRTNGFEQTTLTNFERSTLRGTEERFQYEESSFQPQRFDMLGFGPSAITFTADARFHEGRKTLNPDLADEYVERVQGKQNIANRYFHYHDRDLRIFYLTRRLAALEIDRSEYQALFGSDPVRDFPSEMEALFREGLVEVTPAAIRPSARGMFYADSIAALLAEQRLRVLRKSTSRNANDRKQHSVQDADKNSNAHGHM